MQTYIHVFAKFAVLTISSHRLCVVSHISACYYEQPFVFNPISKLSSSWSSIRTLNFVWLHMCKAVGVCVCVNCVSPVSIKNKTITLIASLIDGNTDNFVPSKPSHGIPKQEYIFINVVRNFVFRVNLSTRLATLLVINNAVICGPMLWADVGWVWRRWYGSSHYLSLDYYPDTTLYMYLQSLRNSLNTLKQRQNGRHFPDGICKYIFLNEIVWISLKISLKIAPEVRIEYSRIGRLVGVKPLSEPIIVYLLTYICVTRPQWANDWVSAVSRWNLQVPNLQMGGRDLTKREVTDTVV